MGAWEPTREALALRLIEKIEVFEHDAPLDRIGGATLGGITDLDELEHGKRREGVIFGAESFAFKMFVGLGPVIAELVIDFAGIVPEMQPGDAQQRTIMVLGLARA